MNFKKFIADNKVFLVGLAGALALALQQFLGTPDVNFAAVGFAVLIAVLSFFAKEWRGQGVTILGIIGTVSGVFVTLNQTGMFSWQQFFLTSVAAILAAVAPPPKSSGYEKSDLIKEAKAEGEEINPASITDKDK